MPFFVINDDNETSVSEDAEFECFGAREMAVSRARDLAEIYPGQEFHVAETVATVVAPVGKVVVTDLL